MKINNVVFFIVLVVSFLVTQKQAYGQFQDRWEENFFANFSAPTYVSIIKRIEENKGVLFVSGECLMGRGDQISVREVDSGVSKYYEGVIEITEEDIDELGNNLVNPMPCWLGDKIIVPDVFHDQLDPVYRAWVGEK